MSRVTWERSASARRTVYTKCVPDFLANHRLLMCYKTGMIKRSLIRPVRLAVTALLWLGSVPGEWFDGLHTVYAQSSADNPVVQIDTSAGSFSLEMFPSSAPVTVANFLKYVSDGDFD